jgi:hypothetical protein
MVKSALLSSMAAMGVPSDGSLDSLRILQGTSRELKRGEKQYIADARAGDIFLEGHEPPLISGEKGLDTIILHVRPAILETPANGDLITIAEYREAPSDGVWAEEIDENGRKKRAFRRTSNRNLLKKTLFLSVALVEKGRPNFDALHTLRVNGRGLTSFSEGFTKPISRRSMKIRSDDGQLFMPPIFGVVTHITTELTSNDSQTWYIPTFKITKKAGDVDGPTDDDLDEAQALHEERCELAKTSYDPLPAGFETGPPEPPTIASGAQPAAKVVITQPPLKIETVREATSRRLWEPPPPSEAPDGPDPDEPPIPF